MSDKDELEKAEKQRHTLALLVDKLRGQLREANERAASAERRHRDAQREVDTCRGAYPAGRWYVMDREGDFREVGSAEAAHDAAEYELDAAREEAVENGFWSETVTGIAYGYIVEVAAAEAHPADSCADDDEDDGIAVEYAIDAPPTRRARPADTWPWWSVSGALESTEGPPGRVFMEPSWMFEPWPRLDRNWIRRAMIEVCEDLTFGVRYRTPDERAALPVPTLTPDQQASLRLREQPVVVSPGVARALGIRPTRDEIDAMIRRDWPQTLAILAESEKADREAAPAAPAVAPEGLRALAEREAVGHVLAEARELDADRARRVAALPAGFPARPGPEWRPVAHNTGDGWAFCWEDETCGEAVEAEGWWPPDAGEFLTPDEVRALGFEIV